jgi:hypothetical protein
MLNGELKTTLEQVARYYDQKKAMDDAGGLGFRRPSDLTRLVACLDPVIRQGILVPGESLFLDMGCADGRVNVLLSYLVRKSIGVEVHGWILDEYGPLKTALEANLKKDNLHLPPDNTYLVQGNALDDGVHQTIREKTGVRFEEFDLFYTYLTMYEETAELIARKGKKGSVLMVYGLGNVMPSLKGLSLLTPEKPLDGILGLYQKD